MDLMPTYVVPFILAALAVAGGLFFQKRNAPGEPNSLVRNMLFAVALGCVVVGLWVLFSSH